MRSIHLSAVVATTLAVAALSGPRAVAAADEGRFEQTLTVGAPATVSILAGAGDVVVRRGAAGTVLVRGRITAGDGWMPAQNVSTLIRQLEAQPPIAQQGNSVTIGRLDDEQLRRLTVSYDVTVPDATDLQVKAGSGDVQVEGLGRAVSISAGSGSVNATGLSGSLEVNTGSGDITVARVGGDLKARSGSGSLTATGVSGSADAKTGSGEVRLDVTGSGSVSATSSSGDVRVTGARGSLTAQSSSGDIVVDGVPGGAWSLHSSSGDISVRLGEAIGFSLDAQTASGRIQTAAPVTMSGELSKKALRGDVRGGGPRLELRTASGDIDVR